MSPLNEHLARSNDIIGERTSEEKKYDLEIIKGLDKGKNIWKAIEVANRKYPKEALQVDEGNIKEVRAYYEYLLQHEKIMEKLSGITE